MKRNAFIVRRWLAGLALVIAGCSESTNQEGDAASRADRDGAVDVLGTDATPDVDAADARDESDALDDGTNDGRDGRDSTLPPRCLGDHAPCGRYGGNDNPFFCMEHGCTWNAGGCSGTPHTCPSLTQNICNSHEGCVLQ